MKLKYRSKRTAFLPILGVCLIITIVFLCKFEPIETLKPTLGDLNQLYLPEPTEVVEPEGIKTRFLYYCDCVDPGQAGVVRDDDDTVWTLPADIRIVAFLMNAHVMPEPEMKPIKVNGQKVNGAHCAAVISTSPAWDASPILARAASYFYIVNGYPSGETNVGRYVDLPQPGMILRQGTSLYLNIDSVNSLSVRLGLGAWCIIYYDEL